jgi:hypothetical protein
LCRGGIGMLRGRGARSVGERVCGGGGSRAGAERVVVFGVDGGQWWWYGGLRLNVVTLWWRWW